MTLIDRNLLGELVNNDNVHYEDIMSIPTVNVNNLIVKELEKIREEIENDQDQMANEKDWGRYYGMGWSIRIIDKHISELKEGAE